MNLDNWDEGALVVDVPANALGELHHVKFTCPWCAKGHFVVLEDERRSMAGRHLCDGCGEFFKFEIVNLESRTRRSRARPKLQEGG